MPHILLAEDDDSMREFLEMALKKAGHDVTATADGLEALAALDKDDSYDLLLTDIVMPGMDGIELSQTAAKKRPDLKVMFITGFTGIAKSHSVANDKAHIVSKPFHLNDLVEQVETLLAA
ncbi:MAG: transcriptional regulator [Micavibrio sp.]|nr:MAG: transcriptional regulator [Micavibrio sp.]